MTTRAAVCREVRAPWEIVDLELDEPAPGEVLLRFHASGLCHSDEHLQQGDAPMRFPFVGGHEGAGVVEAVGAGVTRVSVGDHVVCSFIPVCGRCRYCSTSRQYLCDAGLDMATGAFPDGSFRFHLDGQDLGGFCVLGTFAERAVVTEQSCVPIPRDLPFDLASLLGCGIPTGWGSSVHVAGARPGQTVVVYGAGGVGSNAVQGAALAGATVVVVDPVGFKRDMAKVFGASYTFSDAASAREFVVDHTRGELADHAIVTVGLLDDEVLDAALNVVGKAGQVTVTAVGGGSFDHHPTFLTGYVRRIQGAVFGGSNPLVDIPTLIDLYREGRLKIDELITRRYRLEEINEAYRDLRDGKNIRGVIVHDTDGAVPTDGSRRSAGTGASA